MRLARSALAVTAMTALFLLRPVAASDILPTATPVTDDAGSVQWPTVIGPTVARSSLEDGFACHREPGIIAYVDWINWKLRDPGMEFANSWAGDTIDDVPTSMDTQYVGVPRNSGIRVGLGYRFCSEWEIMWNYTYFHAAGEASAISVPGIQVVTPGSTDENFAVAAAFAASSFNINVHDFEIGRWVNLCDRIDLRLFGGFRWARTESDFNVSYSDVGGVSGNNAIAGAKSQMDAYGIRLGGEYRWKLGDTHLSFFGRGAGSVLAGDFLTSITTSDLAGDDDVVIKVRRDVHVVPVLEAAAGVAWEYSCWELSIGYELAAWFNQSPNCGIFYGNPNSYGDILLDGLLTRVSYKY
ncbi:MAG: Lpg1974 family pore-forming outer membrane protein [Planctomycetota bacterium]|nr:Lpg1974 family pore-forming outer membrane protein [Planctomycetota bacterium]